ncbi:MAG: hypothetical protein HQL12_03750 [Candidatus Omnitrophica bacterium]|nr:hypothetical protein [Candidatus Omnitrophota bacterium]
MILRLEAHKVIVAIFFVIFLGVGIFIVKDYGMSWDEPGQRENGIVAFDYVIKGDQKLLKYAHREYGTFFETVLVVLEKGLHLTDNSRALYLMRHFVTFLLFYLGTFFSIYYAQEFFVVGRQVCWGVYS